MEKVVQLVSVTVWILDLDFKNSNEAFPKEKSPRTECTQDVALLLEDSPVPKIPIFVLVYIKPFGPKPGEAQFPKFKIEIKRTSMCEIKNRFKKKSLFVYEIFMFVFHLNALSF